MRTKNVIHERVEFNELRRAQGEDINSWQTRCRQQGGKYEYCDQCMPELIRDRFIVGINDITLIMKLINSAVKPKVPQNGSRRPFWMLKKITFDDILPHFR